MYDVVWLYKNLTSRKLYTIYVIILCAQRTCSHYAFLRKIYVPTIYAHHACQQYYTDSCLKYYVWYSNNPS